MNKSSSGIVTIAIAAALGAGLLLGRATAQGPAKLQPQDYIDIHQLIDGYSRLLDNCTNGGKDYADLYTDDATFGVSQEWGRGAKIWFRGRDQLIAAGGGGPDGKCRPQPPDREYHLVSSPVVTPTAGGASATSTLLTITNKTTEHGDPIHWEGGYEDTFVKTAKGWKFKSRVHVWSEVNWTDRPQDMPKRNLADE
jgi:hypothetical protein